MRRHSARAGDRASGPLPTPGKRGEGARHAAIANASARAARRRAKGLSGFATTRPAARLRASARCPPRRRRDGVVRRGDGGGVAGGDGVAVAIGERHGFSSVAE
jgi:hypothetical protein